MTQQEILHLVNVWKLAKSCKECIFSDIAIELATELNNSMFTQIQRKYFNSMYVYIRSHKEEFNKYVSDKVSDLVFEEFPLDFLWMFIDANVYVKWNRSEYDWQSRCIQAMEEFYSELGGGHEN